MKTSQSGLDAIKKFEVFRSQAYLDSGGVLTIGFGSTRGVTEGMVIGTKEAEERLQDDLRAAEEAVNRLVTVPLSQDQFDALVSFVFNVGEGAFQKSTLLRKLNAGDHDSVPVELMKWVHVKKKRVEGLANRRAAEAGIWARGSFVASNTVPAEPPAPSKAPVVGGTILAGATVAAQTVSQFEGIWTTLQRIGLSPHILMALTGLAVLGVVVWQVVEWRKGR